MTPRHPSCVPAAPPLCLRFGSPRSLTFTSVVTHLPERRRRKGLCALPTRASRLTRDWRVLWAAPPPGGRGARVQDAALGPRPSSQQAGCATGRPAPGPIVRTGKQGDGSHHHQPPEKPWASLRGKPHTTSTKGAAVSPAPWERENPASQSPAPRKASHREGPPPPSWTKENDFFAESLAYVPALPCRRPRV